ncbi:MAG: calcium/sodium antiporter [Deltaproteobacteria bacterium]|nr:calcium/sodium antiporter [Deltaproteobacteria bacterium]
MVSWLLVLLGLVLLTGGAEFLVRGSSALAGRLGVSTLVIGMTVVAYGTSAPELAVSVIAVLRGSDGLAIGNVVGSNISNLGLVLGLAALINPLRAEHGLLKRELPFMLVAALMVPLLGWDGDYGRGDGVAFLLGALLFTAVCFSRARSERREDKARKAESDEVPEPSGNLLLDVVFTLGGTVALVGGGDVLVRGATDVATQLGVTERVIGLSIVALGTSLPELATSLVAARKGELDLAVGNVIGSNIFNVFFILGSAATVRSMNIGEAALSLDVVIMLVLSFAMIPMIFSGERISRLEGALLALTYCGFAASLFLR